MSIAFCNYQLNAYLQRGLTICKGQLILLFEGVENGAGSLDVVDTSIDEILKRITIIIHLSLELLALNWN